MRYIYHYSIASILFLAVVMPNFFAKRRFPSRQNKIFHVVLILAFFDILFDISSSWVIERVFDTPWPVILINNMLFYGLQLIFPAVLFVYVVEVTGRWHTDRTFRLCALALAGLLEALVFMNPLMKWVFYVDPVLGYVRGPVFIHMYIYCALVLGASAVYLVAHRRNVSAVQFLTISFFLIVSGATLLIQIMLPQYLLTGLGITLSVTVMYLTMQKPEAMLDQMTGAFNRYALFAYLNNCHDTGAVYQMIVVELHNMRRTNRIFGISFGNDVITALARMMSESTRKGRVFRFVGNTFVLITHSEAEHTQALNAIRDALQSPCIVRETEISLRTTIMHMVQVPVSYTANDVYDLIETSFGEVPYGECSEITEAMLENTKRRNRIETALVEAVATDGLSIYIQPIMNIHTGRFDVAEILVRFEHELMGFISPAEFIPIAEKQGLVAQIDDLVMRKTCQFIREHDPFHTLGLEGLEINLSPVEFSNEQFVARVETTVREYGVDPRRILFEVTETTAVSEFHTLSTNIEKLRADGFQFVLDDYGTGYSNISRLMTLPFCTIKLDKAMVYAAMTVEQSRVVLYNTVRMFKELGVQTIAEGVERREESAFLSSLGVDRIQGYLYAKPMPVNDACAFLRAAQEAVTDLRPTSP